MQCKNCGWTGKFQELERNYYTLNCPDCGWILGDLHPQATMIEAEGDDK